MDYELNTSMFYQTKVPFSCSQCDRPLQFKSEFSVGLICPECQTVSRRVQLESNTLDKMEAVREDMSVIRLGTTGSFEETSFEVIGRIQYFFQETYRNHWFLHFNNGTSGWLGDWAGNYSIFKIVKETRQTFENPVITKKIQINNSDYFLEKIDVSFKVMAEGELPGFYLNNEKFIRLEFNNLNGGLALAHVFTKNQLEAFTGQYVEVGDLQFQNFRQHHDWA
ncbi:hypothetical protein AHMF7605_03990 [Adhaeribacter arboris]|uniref:DUF4178 domain-containing protein n=1 Tax=Adhaeribacter arboris TaxID=2072846 RepID=A0A2T2YB34_9BACT|nr:DUF4178 domain-containing protein [Adhaeribacter arboris]PSR52740.1 hypothetical protein AHMF7605_03990 [Adhaeribacter arboris]